MTRQKYIKLKKLFIRLKRASDYFNYHKDNSDKQEQVMVASEKLIQEFEKMGIGRNFCYGLIIFGNLTEYWKYWKVKD